MKQGCGYLKDVSWPEQAENKWNLDFMKAGILAKTVQFTCLVSDVTIIKIVYRGMLVQSNLHDTYMASEKALTKLCYQRRNGNIHNSIKKDNIAHTDTQI